MKIKPKERLEHVGFRVREDVRDEIRQLAKQNKVKEADVLRHIVDDFFSRNRQQNGYGKSLNQRRNDEPPTAA